MLIPIILFTLSLAALKIPHNNYHATLTNIGSLIGSAIWCVASLHAL